MTCRRVRAAGSVAHQGAGVCRHAHAHVHVRAHVHVHVHGVLGGFVTASSSSFSPMRTAMACGS